MASKAAMARAKARARGQYPLTVEQGAVRAPPSLVSPSIIECNPATFIECVSGICNWTCQTRTPSGLEVVIPFTLSKHVPSIGMMDVPPNASTQDINWLHQLMDTRLLDFDGKSYHQPGIKFGKGTRGSLHLQPK